MRAGPGGVRHRSTIRWRLTSLFGALFVLCGVVLLATSYVTVRASLEADEGTSSERVVERYGWPEDRVQPFYDFPVPPPEDGSEPQVETVGDVIAGVQSDITDDALRQLVLGSGVALVGFAVVSVGVGWFAAGRALRPVGELTAQARSLSEENLDQRIALEGPADEIKELADTLDGLIARLDEAFGAQRAFAAQVSHELRTPLSIIRAEADVALSQSDVTEREARLASTARDAVDRTEALLDSLLALARSESTLSDRSPVDLGEVAGDVVAERVGRADAAGVRLELDLAAPAPAVVVEGDRWLLERLVANLVDNGITHNAADGWLEVRVERRGDRVIVATSNPGEVYGDSEVQAILEPFQRTTDSRRPGHGLGMTIVSSVARAHGGGVRVQARPGGGLDVTVELPAQRSSRPAAAPTRAAPVDDGLQSDDVSEAAAHERAGL